MFAFFRSWLRRRSPPAQVQEHLFRTQKTLAKELQALMRAYERRVNYLQTHLLTLTPEQAQQNQRFFAEAQQSLMQITTRLRLADQGVETLLREWHDWIEQSQVQTLSQEARERLEILRSELTLRGLLPKARERGVVQTGSTNVPKKRVSTYQPTILADDDLRAFDEVFAPRLQAEQAWLDHAWQQALHVGVRLPWKVWLTHRRKRLYGWKKRLTKAFS